METRGVKELDQALAEIAMIRTQIARSVEFRGFGPATVAVTGLLAAIAAMFQAIALPDPRANLSLYLALWVGTALVSVTFAGAEVITRSRRVHSSLADEMILSAVEHFLPAALCAALLTAVVATLAPESAWMLPGLWQMLFALGVFAACRFLPRTTIWVAAWYFVTGFGCLLFARGEAALAPWSMGVPFGFGELLAAALLHRALHDGED